MSYNYPQYTPVPQNSTTAVISLIAGICGLTVFPIIGSIVAVITGHMAKGEIARSGGQLGGSGAATWGLVLGYIGLGLSVLGICFFVAILALGFLPLFLIPFSSISSDSLLPLVLGLA